MWTSDLHGPGSHAWSVRTFKRQLLIGTFPPEIPGKPEIVDPASELTAGVPNKVQKQKMEGSLNASVGLHGLP